MPQQTTDVKPADVATLDRSSPPTKGERTDRAQRTVLVVTAPPRPGKMSWSIAPL
ncbi:hypothetical protein [Methylotetracoccus oryzae]|uniref:hypothetical protein n=1 Tax=Methylotetracoccus oryzae TaxID=1919059 RepID=UPI0013A5B6C0|nr:hypothetical protein [Methylotetracoccus oryzae]